MFVFSVLTCIRMGKRAGRELEIGDDVARAREEHEEDRGWRVERDGTYLVRRVTLEQPNEGTSACSS